LVGGFGLDWLEVEMTAELPGDEVPSRAGVEEDCDRYEVVIAD
jgi:hypothetical protein